MLGTYQHTSLLLANVLNINLHSPFVIFKLFSNASSVSSYPRSPFQTFVVIKMSSLGIPDSRTASPTPLSFSYTVAVSIERYPTSSAVLLLVLLRRLLSLYKRLNQSSAFYAIMKCSCWNVHSRLPFIITFL